MIRLCAIDDIPETEAVGIIAPGGEVVLLRHDGEIRAFRNHCPHLGIELNFQPDVFLDGDGAYIQCANHGALFQKDDGLCVFGPCQGQSLVAVPVQLVDGAVWMPADAPVAN